MKITACSLTITISLILSATPSKAYAELLRYHETTGNVSQDFTWEINRDAAYTRVIITRASERSVIEQDKNHGVISWDLLNPAQGTSLTVRRSGNAIHITGTFKKKPVKRDLAIDEAPWCQPIAFALIPFAASTKKSLTFWSINPRNLTASKLRAEKIGTETLMVKAGSQKPTGIIAEKIKVSLTGFRSNLWRAFYWFRKDTGVYLKYQGTNGPPGTPETKTLLTEINP